MKKILYLLFILTASIACNGKKDADKCKPNNPDDLTTFKELDLAIGESKKTNKPVLIYFSSYVGVNCRVFEEYILTNSCIQDKLNDQFVFLKLYTDDKVNDEGSNLQSRFMGMSIQPAWVVIDANERLFTTLDGSSLKLSSIKNSPVKELIRGEADKFMFFLDKGLEAVKNKDTLALPKSKSEEMIIPDQTYTDYETLPVKDQVFNFDFSFNRSSDLEGILSVQIRNPKGVELLAPKQESDMFIPMQIVFDSSVHYELNGELKFPKPDRLKDPVLEETRLYYDDKQVVFTQVITLKSRELGNIKGQVIFSWINGEVIYAPVCKKFEVKVD